MNRINVILICITALAIFYILQKGTTIDIEQYETRINILQQKITFLEGVNDSLEIESKELEAKLLTYDSKIKNLNNEVNVIKRETKAKLDSIDKFGDDELERFFSERYYTKTDSIN
jgi:predicted RNase H-like nuclease (RuvC/YqgF family)